MIFHNNYNNLYHSNHFILPTENDLSPANLPVLKHIYFCVTNDLRFDQRMGRICQSLSASGYEVTLVGRKLSSGTILPGKPYHQVILECHARKGRWMYLEYNIRLFFFLLKSRPDLITAIDLDTILPCYLISIIRKIPRAYDAHELFTEMKEVITRPAIHKAWLTIEKWMVPRFPRGYTVSQSIADEFEKRYGVQYGVIMNTPVLQARREKKSGVKSYLLYQGAVNEGRGLEWLIPAMNDVNAELWICGEGNFSDSCRQLIKDHSLTHKVLVKGMLSPEELLEVSADAYAGINLVEPLGLNQLYSLANKFFDYIHAGIPQLTMDFPEYRRINEQYEVAILIKTLTPQIIAGALNNLLQNEVLHHRLLTNCHAAAFAFNWQNEENKLRLFYKNLFD
jgi:glycosyltransferase involved in cell wall biosynthesis